MAHPDDSFTVAEGSMPFPTRKSIDTSDFSDPVIEVKEEHPTATGSRVLSLIDADYTKLRAESDSGYYSVALPSNFLPYAFKTLSVRLVDGRAQAKFIKAAKERSTRYSIEAVSSLIGDGISAFDLTILDFYYLLYWLRFASYVKFEFHHVAICRNPDHIKQCDTGEDEDASENALDDKGGVPPKKLDIRTLRSVHFISRTTLEERALDPTQLSTLKFPVLTSLGVTLRPATMRDVADFGDIADPDKPDFAEIEYLGDMASYVATVNGKRLTFAERMEFVGTLDTVAIEELESFVSAVSDYGVKESITVTCPTCSHPIHTEVAVSADSFLR